MVRPTGGSGVSVVDDHHLAWSAAGQNDWARAGDMDVFFVDQHLARRVFHARFDGDDHAFAQYGVISWHVRWWLGQLQPQAVAQAPDVVAEHACWFQNPHHGFPELRHFCAWARDREGRFGGIPDRFVRTQCGVVDFAETEVAVEVAEVAVDRGADVDDQHIAVFDDAIRQRFLECPQVQQCYYVTGDIDFILIIAVKDMKEYEKLTRELFFEGGNVKRFMTFVAMDRVKVSLDLKL